MTRSRPRAAKRAQPAPAPEPNPAAPAAAAAATMGLMLIALALVALAVVARRWHPVGDTATESDFYSGYAYGARLLQHGRVDFARWGVYGPVYEAVLAGVGFLVRDLYGAAQLVSALAAAATMFAWWAIARARFGGVAALFVVAMLAVNPTFGRYAYSVTTDMTAVAMFSLAVWALLEPRSGSRLLLAGVLAGLATLTRYNLAMLLPAGALLLTWRPAASWRDRLAPAATFLGGALVVLLPWTLASLAAGHLPGATLLGDRSFYLGGANPGDVLEERYRDIGAGIGAQTGGLAQTLARLASGVLTGGGSHLKSDAGTLLGWPTTALVLVGIAWALTRRRAAVFLPFVPIAILTYLPLAPIYYTERYSLVLLPLFLLPAAWLVAHAAAAARGRPAPLAGAWALALAVLVPTAVWAVLVHQGVHDDLPFDARANGVAMRARVEPGARMIARKGQAPWYAGLEPAAFPLVKTLPELAAYAREHDARYLYYSRTEFYARPEFGFLLDTAAVVPGLAPILAVSEPPVAVYRIGAGFGDTPAWWSDAPACKRISTRVNALTKPGEEATRFYLQLARDGLARGRDSEALRDAEAAARRSPGNAEATELAAEARRRLAAAPAR